MIFDMETKHTRELEGNESILLCELYGHEIEGKVFHLDDIEVCEDCYDEALKDMLIENQIDDMREREVFETQNSGKTNMF